MGDDYKGHYSDTCRYHDINELLFIWIKNNCLQITRLKFWLICIDIWIRCSGNEVTITLSLIFLLLYVFSCISNTHIMHWWNKHYGYIVKIFLFFLTAQFLKTSWPSLRTWTTSRPWGTMGRGRLLPNLTTSTWTAWALGWAAVVSRSHSRRVTLQRHGRSTTSWLRFVPSW